MSINLSPPPLQVPGEFASSKPVAAFFSGLLNTLYQLWTAVYGIRLQAKITTTDAAATAIVRIEVPSNITVMIEARVIARRTGGTAGTIGDSAWYRLTGAYKNINGVMTGIGTPELVQGEDQAGWGVLFGVSDNFAIVAVTGAVNNDITWEGTVSTYAVGA